MHYTEQRDDKKKFFGDLSYTSRVDSDFDEISTKMSVVIWKELSTVLCKMYSTS